MTTAQKLEIKNRLLEMRDETRRQKNELEKETQKKNQKLEDLKDISNTNSLYNNVIGLTALTEIIELIRKISTIQNLRKNHEVNSQINAKEQLINNLYEQVKERLDIVEKAEGNNLKDFLKENDVFSIFEKGKLEEFLNNKESKNMDESNNSKESNSNNNIEKKNQRIQEKEVDNARER